MKKIIIVLICLNMFSCVSSEKVEGLREPAQIGNIGAFSKDVGLILSQLALQGHLAHGAKVGGIMDANNTVFSKGGDSGCYIIQIEKVDQTLDYIQVCKSGAKLIFSKP